jgi:transcriptional regulator with XRE-family HTH domain
MARVELGERIATQREEQALTQVELAERARISPSTLSLIESGKVPHPQVGTIRKIARALGVEPQDLRRTEEVVSPKAETPPDLQQSLNGLLEEERHLSYLSSWRAYVWKLVKRWENEPPETPREVSVVMDAMQALIDAGAFQRPPDELTTSDTREFGEWFELNQLFRGLDRLNRIAEDVEADAEAERRRAMFQEIQGMMAG